LSSVFFLCQAGSVVAVDEMRRKIGLVEITFFVLIFLIKKYISIPAVFNVEKAQKEKR